MDTPTTQSTKMSDFEKREYDMRRLDFFKATIAVILIYAIVILLISAVGIFSDEGYKFLFQEGYVFIVTLVVGVLLIVGLLLYQIFTYKMQKKTVISGDTYVCPDYWELKKTPDNILTTLEKRSGVLSGESKNPGNVKSLSTYYCKDTRDTNTKGSMTVTSSNPPTAHNSTLKFIAEEVYGAGTNTLLPEEYRMNCSVLYPAYMESKDTYKTSDNRNVIDNKLRCEYLKQCSANNNKNVVWSGICP